MTQNKKILILGIMLAVVLGLFYLSGIMTSKPIKQEFDGKIFDIFVSDKQFSLLDKNNNNILFFIINNQTKIFDKENREVDFSYLRKGFNVYVKSITRGGHFSTANEIRILEEPNIIVFSPQENEEIGLPLVVKGEARVFENTVNWRLKDEDGAVLAENFTTARSPDVGQYGSFEVEWSYKEPKGEKGVLEVFDYSAKDGSEIDKVTINVRFKSVEPTTVTAFFGNERLNPGAEDCRLVFPVERRVPKTQAVARAALEELLKGVSVDEAREGYFTSINPGVKINSIIINGGTATADFDETLEFAVGGSCRVAAIRFQIAKTLLQFPTVKNVIISIDGRTEDILQP